MTDSSSDQPRPNHFWTQPYTLFGMACALILTLFVTAYLQSSAAAKSQETLREKSLQLDAVDALLIDLLNSETGVRGFLITGEYDYLEPYVDAVSNLDSYLGQVSSSVDELDNTAGDLARLSELLDRYKDKFQGLIDSKRYGEPVDLPKLHLTKDMLDEMRAVLGNFKQRLLRDAQAHAAQASRGQKATRWAIFALCAAAFGFLIWLFSTLQRQGELRRTIVEMLEQENSRLDREVGRRTRQLNRLASQLTKVSEAEKQRLARELHDDLGASLTAAKMDATFMQAKCQSDPDNPILPRVTRLIASLDHAITLKRRLTSDLLPPLLSQLGLFEALRSLAEDLQRDKDGVDVYVRIPETQPELSHNTSLALFRIAQEAMTNIRKYANANLVTVSVAVDAQNLQMTIEDDGSGFDLMSVKDECFGLISMGHRAKMVSADFRITSKPGEGTLIEVLYPLATPKGD